MYVCIENEGREGNMWLYIQMGFGCCSRSSVLRLNKIWICLFVDIKVRDAVMSTITKSNSTTHKNMIVSSFMHISNKMSINEPQI